MYAQLRTDLSTEDVLTNVYQMVSVMRSKLSVCLVLLTICMGAGRAEKEPAKAPKFTVEIHDAVLDDDPLLVQACTQVRLYQLLLC